MSTAKWKEENKDKCLQYHRDYYEKNKQKTYDRVQERRKELREWLTEYKSTLKCEKCGENHPACLEFHHLDPNKKEENLSQAVNRGWSKERMLKEIDKCIVLCANCHRKLHND